MKQQGRNVTLKSTGFTLLELVLVIILLGVLATATTQFLVIGVNTYTNTAGRFALIDNARFAIERLNRELRHALPNSIRTTNAGNCIEFVPIKTSGTYIALPIHPSPASNSGTVVTPNKYTWQSGDKLAVYVTASQEAYGAFNKVFSISGISQQADNSSTLSFSNAIQFSAPSPNQRFYITNESTLWCVSGQQLLRSQPSTEPGVLMATGLEQNGLIPFTVSPASMSRNALSSIELRFTNFDEQVVFHNEIQSPNQP